MIEPIRVLQVFGIMDCGGAENMVMNLYRLIDKTKVQFDFVVHKNYKGALDEEIISLGGKIYHCPNFSLFHFFKYKKWWKTFLKTHNEYKILHSHVRSSAIIYLKMCKKYNITSISHSHSTSNGKGIRALAKRFLQLKIKKYADYFFSCSRQAGEWLFGKEIVESKRFYILKNAIDLKNYQFSPEGRKKVRDELSINNEDVVFIHVGRFHLSKNHLFLINVFKLIYQSHKNARLLLVGDGDLRSSIEKQVNELCLGDKVIFAGIRDDVPSLLMASDCFLFPSNWEGLPLAVIEAQAAGLPCFVSENVTHEVKITNLIRFLPIDRGEKVWADAILKCEFDKINSFVEIKDAGYDVAATAKWLANFYRKLYQNEKIDY